MPQKHVRNKHVDTGLAGWRWRTWQRIGCQSGESPYVDDCDPIYKMCTLQALCETLAQVSDFDDDARRARHLRFAPSTKARTLYVNKNYPWICVPTVHALPDYPVEAWSNICIAHFDLNAHGFALQRLVRAAVTSYDALRKRNSSVSMKPRRNPQAKLRSFAQAHDRSEIREAVWLHERDTQTRKDQIRKYRFDFECRVANCQFT